MDSKSRIISVINDQMKDLDISQLSNILSTICMIKDKGKNTEPEHKIGFRTTEMECKK